MLCRYSLTLQSQPRIAELNGPAFLYASHALSMTQRVISIPSADCVAAAVGLTFVMTSFLQLGITGAPVVAADARV